MEHWKSKFEDQKNTLNQLNSYAATTIHGSLGIKFTEIGEDYLEASMPVDHRTHQPYGLLHGGASVVLAESLGSVASQLVSSERFPDRVSQCVGIEINASHLKAIQKGVVFGRVTSVKIGRTLHIWEIRVRESAAPNAALICIARLSVLVKSH